MTNRVWRRSLDAEQNFSVELPHGIGLHALAGLAAEAGREFEFVGVERTDDFAAARYAFGERTLLVRTAILRGKKPSVALPENGDLLPAHQVTAAVSGRDFFDAAEIDDRESCSWENQPLFSAVARA